MQGLSGPNAAYIFPMLVRARMDRQQGMDAYLRAREQEQPYLAALANTQADLARLGAVDNLLARGLHAQDMSQLLARVGVLNTGTGGALDQGATLRLALRDRLNNAGISAQTMERLGSASRQFAEGDVQSPPINFDAAGQGMPPVAPFRTGVPRQIREAGMRGERAEVTGELTRDASGTPIAGVVRTRGNVPPERVEEADNAMRQRITGQRQQVTQGRTFRTEREALDTLRRGVEQFGRSDANYRGLEPRIVGRGAGQVTVQYFRNGQPVGDRHSLRIGAGTQ